MRFSLLALALLLATPAAAITVTVNPIGTGTTPFGGATTLMDWRNLFAPNASWGLGVAGGPAVTGFSFADTANGGAATGSLFITNWIDGNGFGNGPALPDLGINSIDDWALSSSVGWRRIGFAMSTGVGLYPREVGPGAANYTVATSAGAASFSLPQAGTWWVTITAPTAVSAWSFTEAAPAGITDQYFGNVYATNSVPGGVPEPASWAMLIAGFGLVGAIRRRQRMAAA